LSRKRREAIRHEAFFQFLSLSCWLISGWLGVPSAHKTFLENLSMPYEAVPSNKVLFFVESFYKLDEKKANCQHKEGSGSGLIKISLQL
jgi:hypothetical protein